MPKLTKIIFVILFGFVSITVVSAEKTEKPPVKSDILEIPRMSKKLGVNGRNWPFRGICLSVPKPEDYENFKRLIKEFLPRYNCNTLVLLIRYNYKFESFPQVTDEPYLNSGQAKEISSICKEKEIKLIIKMNLFGHQTDYLNKKETKFGLLRAFPDFDETKDNPDLKSTRSICPNHPEVKKVVFALADEMIKAFNTDTIHVGMDEVFEIGECERCKGVPANKIFAEWVNALYDHFVKEKKLKMLMWGDRLLNSKTTGYGAWEASSNETWGAIDIIPKDIILCDWHYDKMDNYPSVKIFSDKGFQTIICPWKDLKAAKAFLEFAAKNKNGNMLGALCTTWCDSGAISKYLLGIDAKVEKTAAEVSEVFKYVMMF